MTAFTDEPITHEEPDGTQVLSQACREITIICSKKSKFPLQVRIPGLHNEFVTLSRREKVTFKNWETGINAVFLKGLNGIAIASMYITGK